MIKNKNKERGYRNMRRAQSALEFLVTYGWAITIIVISIGVLTYYGLFDASRYMSDYCSFGPQLECIDYEVKSDSISLYLRNNYGFPIQIINYSLIQDGQVINSYTPKTDTLAECLSVEGEDHMDECGALTTKTTCEGNDACDWINGYVDIDKEFLLDSDEWTGSETLNLNPGRKQEIGVIIYLRRIDPANADESTPSHRVKGVVFTKIKK